MKEIVLIFRECCKKLCFLLGSVYHFEEDGFHLSVIILVL